MACCCGAGCSDCAAGCGCIGDVLDVTLSLGTAPGCTVGGLPAVILPSPATFQLARTYPGTGTYPFTCTPPENACPRPQTCETRWYRGFTTIQVLFQGAYLALPFGFSFVCCSYADSVGTNWSFFGLTGPGYGITPTFISPYPGPLVITGVAYPPALNGTVTPCPINVTIVDNHPPYPCP